MWTGSIIEIVMLGVVHGWGSEGRESGVRVGVLGVGGEGGLNPEEKSSSCLFVKVTLLLLLLLLLNWLRDVSPYAKSNRGTNWTVRG